MSDERRPSDWWRKARRWLRAGAAARPRLVLGRRYGLELPGAPVDPHRAARIVSFLVERGLVRRRDLVGVRPESMRALRRVHSDAYLEGLAAPGSLVGILGFDPGDAAHDAYLLSHREQVAGTALAARLARARGGLVVNLGGGFHHALPARGQGFCAFHDVAVAVAGLRASGDGCRVLVVDLDLHDGDGTRRIFAADRTVHTFSIHNRDLAPPDAVESTSLALGDGVDGGRYLEALRSHLPAVVRRFEPALAFYLAGVDPAIDDPLGNWRVGAEALLERDCFVLRELGWPGRLVPTVVLLAGGYGEDAWRYSARFLSWLLNGGRAIEPPESVELTVARFRRLARLMRVSELTVEPQDGSWSLAPEDVDPTAARRRSTRFLDFYSQHGIDLVLERFGIFDKLRALGLEGLHVELRLDDPAGHTLRVLSETHRDVPLAELRVRRDARSVPGASLLAIEWLLLQDPGASFSPQRPRLPGQRHPGLGLLDDVSALLVLTCERLGLDGILLFPAHFHVAALAAPHFRFVDPAAQARFERLREAVADLRLADAATAVERGDVRDRRRGARVCWEPTPMVLPITPALRERVEGPAHQRAVEGERATLVYERIQPRP